MKKIYLLLIIYCILSITSFSKIQNAGGVVFNDTIFGEKDGCKATGSVYLSFSVAAATKKIYGANEVYKIMNESVTRVINSTNLYLVEKEKWNLRYNPLENINSYYKQNCRKVQKGEIKNVSNDLELSLAIEIFYKYLDEFVY